MKHRDRLDSDIGTRDVVDNHPLITCAPHIMSGHAHLKGTRVTLERVFSALLHERPPGPLKLPSGVVVTDEQVRACLKYGIDIFDNISQLYAELGRLRELTPKAARK